MKRGRILHRLAALVCSAKTLERVVEPAIADLQRDERVFPARSYLAVVTVMVLCALDVSNATDDERRVATRTLVWAAVLGVSLTALLVLPVLRSFPEVKSLRAALLLVPQAVPLAIPIGLAFAIAAVLSLRVTPGAGRLILIAACLVSVGNFAVLAWALPAANQTFREFVAGASRSSGDAQVIVPKGPSELTLSELQQEIRSAKQHGEAGLARRYSWTFHLKFALAVASLGLAVVLLSVPVDGRVLRGLSVVLVCFVYWLLLWAGEHTAARGYIWPVAAAWLPNIVLAIIASVMVRLKPDTTY